MVRKNGENKVCEVKRIDFGAAHRGAHGRNLIGDNHPLKTSASYAITADYMGAFMKDNVLKNSYLKRYHQFLTNGHIDEGKLNALQEACKASTETAFNKLETTNKKEASEGLLKALNNFKPFAKVKSLIRNLFSKSNKKENAPENSEPSEQLKPRRLGQFFSRLANRLSKNQAVRTYKKQFKNAQFASDKIALSTRERMRQMLTLGLQEGLFLA